MVLHTQKFDTKMLSKTKDCVNFYVLKNDPFRHTKQLIHPWAFCVHISIFNEFKNVLRGAAKIVTESQIYEYELKVDGKSYDMRVMVVPPGNDEVALYICNAIRSSQVAFTWKDNPNLFINKASFNILQEFITKHKLQQHILKIDYQPGVSTNNDVIAVVTFNQCVKKFNIIGKFEKYLKSVETYDRPNYYSMTYAFPWLQPRWLKHFLVPLDQEFNAIALIILNHLGTLHYDDALNMFDLLALRLALCDYRNPLPSNILKYEIDYMIKRLLAEYVTDHLLDLDKYCIAQNCMQRDMLIGYMIYEFQHFFGTVRNVQFIDDSSKFENTRPLGFIELAHESDAHLNTANRARCEIAGRKYDTMSLSLLLDLIECANIYKIRLDTDYSFLIDACKLNRTIKNDDGNVDLYFEGKNVSNFIEDFVASFKKVAFLHGGVSLYIYYHLMDYTIFDNLSVKLIYFNDIEITTQLLYELNQCNLKSAIGFYNCTLENTSTSWALLNKLAKFDMMEILEDETTWQTLFEFVMEELLRTNSKEFQFDKKNLFVVVGNRNINLASLKFIVDEFYSKLQILNTSNNIMIDLYDIKFDLEPDYCSDYDFYQ